MKQLIRIATMILIVGSAWAGRSDKADRMNAATFEGLAFRAIGPALMSGRISDIAIHPTDSGTWYVAVGSGGVFKTVNSGTTWIPVFDRQTSYSVGCVVIDPHDANTIWVGTGENVSGRHVGYGDGVYRSLNGGTTWENLGLSESEHISRIIIHPQDRNTIFVAAEGPLWASGGERGVYRSLDAGQSWQRVLNLGEETGVADLVMDPKDPTILYAAAYQRRRSVAAFLAGGPESGIFKSVDGGSTWRRLHVGLPKGHMGRIGLAVSPLQPQVVYATIEADEAEKGFYRSADRGESWEKRSDTISGGTGAHYYQEIFADPRHFDRVYQMDVWLLVSDDGGTTFKQVGEQTKHSDNHALAFSPWDPDYLLLGCDGGLYETWDRGGTWKFVANLPVAQFYKLALDNNTPFYTVHGGTQDNFSQYGPSRTLNVHGIRNSDWQISVTADGYTCAIDPSDPNIIYAEGQVGALVRFDRRSGERVFIRPTTEIGEMPDRWNWDAPLIISPHSPKRLYFASQRVYVSEDRGDSWQPISGDLSRGGSRFAEKMMGKYWGVDALWDHGAMSYYGNVTTLSESPLVEGLLYAGTDDGLIQVTEDGGGSWRRADKIDGVPEGAFVNEIRADRHDADAVFAALDHHKSGDFAPYLVRSEDRGRNWRSISGDLPQRHIVWCITQDFLDPELLFVGTEFGIFFCVDGGDRWTKLTGGVPTIAFRDIEIQQREADLVGASFGRGFFILDDYTPLRIVDEASLEEEALLFPVKTAQLYVEQVPLGGKGKAFQGDAFFTAPNPPFGAIFTYYLRDGLQTMRQKRHAMERALEEKDKRIPLPTWEQVRAEDWESPGTVFLVVSDASGRVVQRIEGPTSSGIHRVSWNLRYPPVAPVKLKETKRSPWEEAPIGPLVVPGRYRVVLTQAQGEEVRALTQTQEFVVTSLGLQTLEAPDREALLAFQQNVGGVQRAVLGARDKVEEVLDQLAHMEKAFWVTPGASEDLLQEIQNLIRAFKAVHLEIAGDRENWRRGVVRAPALLDRLDAQLTATAPITQTNRADLARAKRSLKALSDRIEKLIDEDLRNVETRLEAAGAPWTPGRAIPHWEE